MYSKIVVALSLEHGFGQKAIDLARRLKVNDGEIVAVHVFEPIHDTVSLYVPPEHMQKERETAEAEISKRVGGDGDIEIVMLTGHSGRAITDYAKQIDADCIIMGSHEPGLTDYLLGSTTARVVRHAHCAVHVLR